MQPGGVFAPISREGGLLLNNLLLATATATVALIHAGRDRFGIFSSNTFDWKAPTSHPSAAPASIMALRTAIFSGHDSGSPIQYKVNPAIKPAKPIPPNSASPQAKTQRWKNVFFILNNTQ